jgi:arylformamidase
VAARVDVTAALAPGRLPAYPGDTALTIRRDAALADGDLANLSSITCSLHTGTHVDAPLHFLDDGAGVEALPLDALIGPAWVVDASSIPGHVDAAALATLDLPPDAERVLFKTRNAALWESPSFVEGYVALTADAAAVLVDRGVRLVGIDYLSIAPYDDPAPTHEVLLRAGVVIVETLDLRAAEPGEWTLTCLPLLVPGGDGAPARAVLTRP